MAARQLDIEECANHLTREIYGRLATCGHDGQPYVTPVNYVYLNNHIYFHAGLKGRKLKNIAENPAVCFEISGAGELLVRPRACNFSIERWSVLVFGTAKILSDSNQKLAVIQALMEKYAAGSGYVPMTLADMKSINVIAIEINEISGKTS